VAGGVAQNTAVKGRRGVVGGAPPAELGRPEPRSNSNLKPVNSLMHQPNSIIFSGDFYEVLAVLEITF